MGLHSNTTKSSCIWIYQQGERDHSTVDHRPNVIASKTSQRVYLAGHTAYNQITVAEPRIHVDIYNKTPDRDREHV